MVQIFDNENIFGPEVLDINENVLIDHFLASVKTIASISLALKYPTIVSVPHLLVNAYKNLLAISIGTDYTFDGAEKVMFFLFALVVDSVIPHDDNYIQHAEHIVL